MIKLDDPLHTFFDTHKKAIDVQEIDSVVIDAFQKSIQAFYKKNKRHFLWRENITPYRIAISEIMLQQTQTARVVEKFDFFIKMFPDFETLAQASQHQVILLWNGLGYNRRALAVHALAKKIVNDWNGSLPDDPNFLKTCKGIGPATAASITVFAFNRPEVFIETNIRSVFLHIFFHEQMAVADTLLLPLIACTLDRANPREWYYALMDYGVFVKKSYKNPNQKSKHYIKQSRFEGSDRQIRGMIIQLLTQTTKIPIKDLLALDEQKDIRKILNDLFYEGFIGISHDSVCLLPPR